ncbi:MAG: competence protein ComEA [Actinomycetota bacterium]|nr:competence protein ComEA [Actinomycetota bacterium]
MSGIPLPPSWWERLEPLGGKRRDTIVIGAVVGFLVFGGLAMRARGEPASIAPPAKATPSPGPSTTGQLVVVHVAGAVRHPGIIELPAGSRVADAIELAGGALPKANLDLLNLAAVVVDGTQILVPIGTGPGLAGASPVPASTDSSVINLNTADQTLLETVPGLGPVKAGAILAYRTEIGSFTSIDQLLEVSGIGPATLESIKPFVSL